MLKGVSRWNLQGFNGVYAILTLSNVFSQQTETAHSLHIQT